MKKQSELLHATLIHLGPGYWVAEGQVLNDPRFPDLSWVKTSMIQSVDFETNWVHTQNTSYKVRGEIV